jgi:hypothetical protein
MVRPRRSRRSCVMQRTVPAYGGSRINPSLLPTKELGEQPWPNPDVVRAKEGREVDEGVSPVALSQKRRSTGSVVGLLSRSENGGPGQSRTADLRFRKRPLLRKHNNLACVGACSTPHFVAVVADIEHNSEHKKERPAENCRLGRTPDTQLSPTRMLGFASRAQHTRKPEHFRPLPLSTPGRAPMPPAWRTSPHRTLLQRKPFRELRLRHPFIEVFPWRLTCV